MEFLRSRSMTKSKKRYSLREIKWELNLFYYYKDDNKFLFSSELKSFLHFNINKEISIKAIANYITFLWSPEKKLHSSQ